MLKSYLSNFCLKTRALSSFRSLKALGSLLLLLFVGTEAQGILLVSNFSQPTKTDNNGNAEYHSYTESHLLFPGFFTPNTLLHTLTAIKVIIAADGKAPTTINLREVSRNNPIITTFSLQGTYTGSGTNTYIPNKETVLKKNTLYLFALGHSKGGWGHVVQTSSNAEDAASQVGWRTADDLYSERLSKYATPAVKIEVHGNYYFAPVPTLAAGGVLISNIDGGRNGGLKAGRQEFTTGSWPNGYKIRSIEVHGRQSGTLASEGLYQGNTKVADFTATGTPIATFTPTKSLTLAPKTTYSFRVSNNYWITSGSISAHTGWSLGAHSPAVSNNKMRIRIRADEVIAPAVIATPKTLVSNIKQGGLGTIDSSSTSYAQAFRTGINPYGYALRGMGVYFGVTTAPPRATIHENSPTGKKVATFEPPHSGSSLYGLPDYVVLKKTTTYYVVFSGGDAQIRTTPSNHVDDDSLAAYKGWNIAYTLKYESGGTYLAASSNEAIRLRIAGEPLASPPSEPTNVQRTAGNGQVTLTWEPPLVNNYAPLLNYRINYKKTKDPNYSSWKDYPATARRAVIASLTNGEQYDFQIRARSSEGQGPIFKTTATPNVVPPAPRSFKARGAPNNDAYLSWDAPTTGTVDYYQYLYYKSGENGTWTRVPGDASARSVTIGGLQNVVYTFGIRAVNSAGAGTFQSLSRTVGGTAINPPTNLRIKSASTTEATFTWDAPTGAAPTGYQYRYKKDTNNYPLAWTDIASGLEQTITGLTAASTYTFQVRATTSSKISASITLALAPLPPPQNFEVLTGPSKVYFSWDAPATGTVGSYEYFYESTWNPVPGGASARNLAVEISGFEQVLYLRAISNISVGLSVNSGSISFTPVASPTNFRVKSSTPTQATLVWDSAVDTSQIRYKTGTNDYPFAWTDITSGREQTITGLTPGTAYTFQLRSKVGTAVSAPLTATATLAASPSAPQSFKAYRGDHTQAVLVWAAPSTGPTPTAYQYRYKKSSENYPNTWTLIPGGASIRVYTVNNLDGSTYNFQIRAISSSILGTVATATRPSFRNYNIRDIAAKPDNNQVTLTWNAPSSNEDATAYLCSYAPIGGTFSPDQSVSISKHTLTIMGLVNGTTYLFRLYTDDLNSLSPLAHIYVIATPTLAIPSAPQNLTAQAGNTQATLAWTAPATGSTPTAYQYRYRTSGTAYTNNWQDIGGGASTKTYTVTGLTNNTAYDFQVRAKSDSALGTEATVSATPVPSAASVIEGTTFATTVVAASETDDTTFTYSIFGGADRAKFSINSSSGALTFNTAPNFENPTDLASTSPLDSAKNNKYIVTVRATSGSGLSAITTDQTITITVTDIDEAPEAPTAFTAIATTTTLTLSWDAPINAGPPITGYEYRYSSTDGNTWAPPVDISIDALPLTFTEQHTFDYITIRATNDEGTSSWSTPPIVFTTFTPPKNLKATPANTQATLTWTAPTTGTPTGYQYRYRTGSPGTWIDWTDVTSGLSQTITSLINNAAYTFEVRAKSASVTSNAATVNSTPNSPPTFTSLATASITEGTTAVTTLTATDTDTDDNTFTYSIIGGADRAKFSLSAAALTFKTAPDFETPTDLASTNPSNSASNNEYIVTLSVTSGSGDREISTEQTLTITVTDTNEVPTFSSSDIASVTEGTTAVITLVADDADVADTVTYSIIGGADRAKFSLSGAALTFNTAPDFETPTDVISISPSNSAKNNEYIITLRVTSGSNAREMTTDQILTITVADTDEAPEAPAVPTVTLLTSATLTLNWTTPTNTGPPITDYDYRYSTDGNSWTTIDNTPINTTSTSIAGLSASTSYQIAVRATSDEGDSDWSTSASFTTPAAPPSAPRSFEALRSNRTQAVLIWGAPSTGPTHTAYQYRYKKGSENYPEAWTPILGGASIRAYTVNNLDSSAHNFQIRAISSSILGVVATATCPRLFDSHPRDIAAKPDNNQVTLTWNPPARPEGSAYYVYRYATIGGSASILKSVPGGLSARTHTVTGLVNGTTYLFELRLNDEPDYVHIIATPTLITPSAPQNLKAQVGDTQATLTWTAPTTGTPTGYQYRHRTGSPGTWIDWTDVTSGLSQTITSLTNDAAYNFQVRTKSSSGPSTEATVSATPVASAATNIAPTFTSLATASVTEGTTAVITLTATDTDTDDTTFTYSIVAGADRAKFSINSSSGALTFKTAPDFETPTDVISISPSNSAKNNKYIVIVRVTSGSNAREMTTDQILTITVADTDEAPEAPDAPTVTLLTSATLTLNWTAPTNTGPPITDYDYRYSTDGNSWTTIDNTPINTTSTSIAGLSASTSYQIAVRATSDEGDSDWSTSASFTTPAATPSATPSAPRSFQALRSNRTQAVLVWAAPSTGPTHTAYQYRYKKGSENYPEAWTPILGGASIRAYTVNNLDSSAHNFQIRAISSSILGVVATANCPLFYNVDPRDIAAKPDNNQVTLTWNPPASLGGDTYYRYSYAPIGGSFSTDKPVPGGLSARTHTVMGLVNGTTYLFRLRTDDEPDYVYIIATPTLTATPSAPQNLTATPASNQVTLAWTAPASGTPTGYQYRQKTSSDSYLDNWADTSGGTLTLSQTITSLTNNTTYNFQVRAKSDSGSGTEATVNSTPNNPPTFSSSATASVNEGTTAVATLTATDTDTDDNTFTYSIIGGADSDQFSLSAAALSFKTAPDFETPTDLASTSPSNSAKNNEYIITLRVTSGSNLREMTTEQTLTITVADTDEAPEAPAVPTLDSRTPTTLTLNWTAPTNAGPPITDYDYRYRAGNAGAWNIIANDINDALTFTFTTLTASTSYQVGIRATNAEGDSDWSTSTSFTTPAAPPSAPQSLTAAPANTQVTLAWTAPASGTPTGYEYRYKSSGDYNSWTDTTSPKIIASLTNNTPYTFEVRAKSNSGSGAKATVSATPTAPNDPPTFSSLTTASVNEGTTAVTTLTATDPDSDDTTFTYSIFGGADSAKFSINSSSGALTFKTAPDYENPTDATTNNEYIITLRVTSGSNPREMTTEQTLTVTVADTDEAPEAPAAPTFTSLTSTTLTLNWIAPTNTGPPITDYDYRYSTDGNSWTTIANTPIDAISTPIVGLSASTPYYVAVRATNAEGTGSWSTSTTFTTPAASVSTVPSAPQSLMAQVGNQQITLAWEAPATGVTPTGYEYRYKSSGAYNSWTDTTSPKIIASLTNNTPYTFEVRAKSNSGSGAKATVSATPTAPNDPPTFSSLTTASVNEGTTAVTTLTATDPDDTTFTYSIFGGADSAKFSINSSSGALTFKTAPDFENPTDTTTNNEYIITLRVTSGSNAREMTTEQTLTVTVADTDEAPEAPAVPTLDSRTPTTLTLNWTAPTNAGPPITDYDYRYRAGNAGAWNIIANDINDALTFTFTTLTASTSYQVGIRATNAEGTGDWSTSTSFTTLADTPSAPQNLVATAGYAQTTLAWDAPNTGTTPTGYQYRFKVSTDSSYGEWTDVTSGRGQTITDLTPSTAYTFEVRATNTGVGSSPITTTTTPLTPPSAPSNLYAFPNDRFIFLAWDTTHTSFEYRYKTSGGSYNLWANTQHSRRDRIASLTNNVAYTIEVRGKYPLGPSATATAMATPNPVNLTATPSNFVATASSGAVTLTWDAPTGGFPDYQIRYKSGGAYNSWAGRSGTTHDWNGTNFSRTISSLTGSTAYTFEIRGKSGIKYTPTSTATATTPASTAPSAPQNLTATPASTQVTLAWTAPASGTPTGYQYRQKTSSDSYLDNWADTSGRTSTLNQTITSLTNNTTYNFQVRAKSDSGPSTEATVNSTPNSPPTFSSSATASVNEGTISVATLTATDTDTDDNTFTYSIIGGADSDQFSLSAAALSFKTAPDFENPTDATTNNEYIVTLSTTSGSGDREISTSQTLTITVADTDEAPEAPAAPTLDSRTPTTLTLNWTAPTNTGPPITDYDYRYRAGNAGAWNIIANDINDALTFTFTTLTASTSYQVGIRATNAEGTGSWSTSTSFTTLADTPSAPQNLTAQAGNNQVTLAWTAPASGTPTGYEYRYKSSGAYGNWTTATSPKIIASLTNDTPHTFEVRAKSDSGPGETLTISATPLAPPSAPQNLTATPASNQVTLAWTAPASGTPTGYQYRQKTSSDSYLDNWADTSGRTSTLNQTITSLTNNTTYNFQVRAKSDSGPSTEATVNSTPNSPPTFSSSATASVNEGTISVATLTATDTDTDDNTFTYSIIGGADSDQFSLSAAALSFKTAPDFENPTDTTANNEYIVTLSTTSGSGDREISTSQTLTITVADTDEAPAAPAVPTLDSRTPTTLTLNWIAPTNAGPPITDYDYRYRAGNAGAWNIIANDINDALTFTFTTLTASTSYQVGIRATNAEGTGSWSTSTSFTTPAAPPSAPQSLMATPANNQVTLAWEAPATGTPTGYEYRYKSSGDYNSWTDTTTLSQTIASLTNDTAYTFGVRAKSNSGPGTETMVSATPAAPPSAPQSLMAQVGNQQITLAWEAPASGTPTGYEYRYKSSGAYGNWTPATSPKIIASLTNDTPHTFEVRAKSDSGPGETLTISATPILPNSPPTFTSLTTATVNEGTTAVTTLTANDTDSEDTTFTYSIVVGADSAQFSINSSSGALTFNTAPDHETPTDLDSNNEYIVTLSVTSGSNPREITTEQTLTITVTDTNEVPTFTSPNTFDIVENQNTITTLIATDPDSDDNTFTYSIIGGADNAKFSINSSSGALSFKTAPDYENPTDVSILQLSYDAIEDNTYTYDVIKDNTYIVIVRATSGSGNRKMTTEQTLTITITDTNEVPSTPNAPTITSLTSTSLILNWKKPTNTGPPITDYDYRYSTDGNSWTTVANRIDNAMSNPITSTSGDIFYNAIANPITGLNPNTSYYVAVRATNAEGTSSWSTSTTFTTLTTASSTVPSAPQNSVTRISDQNTIYISWTAPATGAAPTGYEYRYKKATDASFTPWVVATEVLRQAQVLKVEDLINDTAYTFEVRAESDSGPGETLIISATPTLSNSPPTFTSLTTATVNEGTTAVTTLIATDPDDTTFTYSIVAGADSAKFSINSSSGALSFKTAPNFENPTDTTSNNEYIVTLSVTSGSNPREITTEQTLTITVTDTNEVPTFTSPNTFDIVENQNTITTLIATDPDSDDNTFTYSILGGADNAKFSLSGATLSFKTAPNFEATQSSANTNTYTLIVTATSGSGNRAITTEQTLTINVTDDTTSNDPIDQKAIGQPIITGSPQIGQRLTTSTTTIDDPIDGLTQPQYTYQWIRIEENGNEVVIQSANSYAYTPTQGDLGRTLKVRVEFIDDSGHSEILTSNATAAVTETTSTKELSAWLTRFGRATADQILNTVEERLRAYRSTGITLHFAGQHLPTHLTEDPQHPTENGVYSDSLLSWLTYGTKDQIQSQNMTEQELLMNSSFDLSAGNQENGFASLWGRMSQSTFQGYQNSLQLDGDITTGLLGADYTRGPWTAGLILSRSKGKGNYQGDTTGKAKASLNSLTPWAAYTGADQLSIWAATGYGKGDISLIPQEGSPQKTDIKLLLAALGTRGTLLDPSTGPRIELFSDARWVQTTSKSTTELKATQTHTARLRLGLEGSWYTTLSTGSVLIPRLTLGLRKDSGDAETGFGTDIGTHITLAMPQGLTLSLEARGLLSHQAKGFQDQGWSGTLQWDSKPDSEQGFTLSLSQSKGAASSGGTHALFAHETLEQLTLTNTDTKLIQANIAYGLPPFGNQLTARSELTLGLSDTTRQYSLAWHVSSSYLSAQSFDLSLQGTRHESIDGALAPRHSLGIQLGRQW